MAQGHGFFFAVRNWRLVFWNLGGYFSSNDKALIYY